MGGVRWTQGVCAHAPCRGVLMGVVVFHRVRAVVDALLAVPPLPGGWGRVARGDKKPARVAEALREAEAASGGLVTPRRARVLTADRCLCEEMWRGGGCPAVFWRKIATGLLWRSVSPILCK